MKRFMIALVICIPLASVCFGGVMFYFAFTSNDTNVLDGQAPMSKTSWKPASGDGAIGKGSTVPVELPSNGATP
ncbi:MAG: hypothetical protein ACFHXK_21215 [bacterium]